MDARHAGGENEQTVGDAAEEDAADEDAAEELTEEDKAEESTVEDAKVSSVHGGTCKEEQSCNRTQDFQEASKKKDNNQSK